MSTMNKLRWLAVGMLTLLVGVVITACDPTSTPSKKAVIPEYHSVTDGEVIQVRNFEWRIVSPNELKRIYTSLGHKLSDDKKITGITSMRPDGRYVIITTAPRIVDDDATTALGHEVMHIALGDYHPETPRVE